MCRQDYHRKGNLLSYLTFFVKYHAFKTINCIFQCVFDVDPENGLTLVEIAEGVEIVDIVQSTGCEFVKADNLKIMGQVE